VSLVPWAKKRQLMVGELKKKTGSRKDKKEKC
jgi:hypothetical protein